MATLVISEFTASYKVIALNNGAVMSLTYINFLYILLNILNVIYIVF